MNAVVKVYLLALQAAEKHWPEVFKSEEATAKKEKVIEDMEAVRPVIETG